MKSHLYSRPACAARVCALAVLLTFALTLPLLTPAAQAVDKYAGEFLKLPVGARAIGMGGAFTAVADDATAVFWNSSGLIFGDKHQLYLEHAEQFGDIVNHDFIGYRHRLSPTSGGASQSIGAGFIRSAVDNIDVDQLDPANLIPGEHYEDTNGNGQWDVGERLFLDNIPYAVDSVAEMAFLLSYARTLGSKLSIGGTLKIIRQSLPDNSSFGIGADLGLMYMPIPSLTAALQVFDVTTTALSWDSGRRETLVPSVALGVQYTRAVEPLRGVFTFAGDMVTTFDNRKTASGVSYGETVLGSDFHGGVEYWYQRVLALRAGATTNALTFGAGFRYQWFGIDYAFAGDHPDLPSSHRVGLSFSF